MIGGVTHHMLPHLPGVPHLHVNCPLNDPPKKNIKTYATPYPSHPLYNCK